jgi:hypothetical protein
MLQTVDAMCKETEFDYRYNIIGCRYVESTLLFLKYPTPLTTMAIRHGDFPDLTADPTLAEEELRFRAKRTSRQCVTICRTYKALSESTEIPVTYYHNSVTATIPSSNYMSEFGCTRLVFSSSATVHGTPPMVPIQYQNNATLYEPLCTLRGVGVHGSLTNAPLGTVSFFPVAVTPSEPGAPRIGSGSLPCTPQCPHPTPVGSLGAHANISPCIDQCHPP